MKLWRIALRNVARNKRRSILSGTAIAVATLAVVLLFSLLAGMLGDTVSVALTYDSGHVRVRHPEFSRYESLNPVHLAVIDAHALQARLGELPEVAAVLPRVRFGGAIYREQQNHAVFGIGVDFAREIAAAGARLPHLAPAAGAAPALDDFARVWRLDLFGGALPDPAGRELVMSKTLADELGVTVGDKLTILTRTAVMSTQAWTFRISGLVGFPVGGLSRVVLLPIGVAQRFLQLDATDAVTDVLLYARTRRSGRGDGRGGAGRGGRPAGGTVMDRGKRHVPADSGRHPHLRRDCAGVLPAGYHGDRQHDDDGSI